MSRLNRPKAPTHVWKECSRWTIDPCASLLHRRKPPNVVLEKPWELDQMSDIGSKTFLPSVSDAIKWDTWHRRVRMQPFLSHVPCVAALIMTCACVPSRGFVSAVGFQGTSIASVPIVRIFPSEWCVAFAFRVAIIAARVVDERRMRPRTMPSVLCAAKRDISCVAK